MQEQDFKVVVEAWSIVERPMSTFKVVQCCKHCKHCDVNDADELVCVLKDECVKDMSWCNRYEFALELFNDCCIEVVLETPTTLDEKNINLAIAMKIIK